MSSGPRSFLRKYKWFIIGAIAVYVALTIVLIMGSEGDEVPFIYQVF